MMAADSFADSTSRSISLILQFAQKAGEIEITRLADAFGHANHEKSILARRLRCIR
jgi:hypothetical protein